MGCHCTQCRKTTGHYLSATQVPTASLTIAGDTLAWFQSSPGARRGFCARCGSSLFWQKGSREMTSIMTGTLDGPTGLTTSTHIHIEDKGDYYAIPESELG